jgi:predicted transcriptional regulator with HTH domain
MRISEEKKEKISEQIMALLYSLNPRSLFISEVAKEIARDEEFVKEILINLKKKGLVIEIRKNPKGIEYVKRARWKISDAAYNAYKKHQG